MANLYTIKRDDICVGKVIKDFELDNKTTNLLGNEIKLGYFTKLRNMLFVKNMDNCAEDLLYTSPQYPIYSEENIENCRNQSIIIEQAHNISKVLRYFGYPEEMTYLDVESMRRRLFDGKFPILNAHSFGLTELDPSQQTYYDLKGNIIKDPQQLKPLIKQRKRMQALGQHLEFVNSDDFDGLTMEQLEVVILSSEYFNILREFGDNTLYDVLCGYAERTDAFKPCKEEGIIRSLKKYN